MTSHSIVKNDRKRERSVQIIEQLKRSVENLYGFNIKNWRVIKKVKDSCFVAQIDTINGEKYALKCLYLTPDRQSFIAKSEQLLAERGVNLACPVQTLKGDLLMLYNQYPYVLYEWIDGESAKLRDQDDLNSIIKLMARFHYATIGLQYPPEISIYEHPHWKKEYKDRIKTIKMWSNSHKKTNDKNEAIINRSLPFFKRMAKEALRELKSSKYEEYINGSVSAKSLVHGDLHHNNVINRKNEKVLIDFEDIRYDLPSKDLLRTYSMYTKNHSFNEKTFSSMMNTYEHYHSLSLDVKQLVFIDLLFPHIFERLLCKKKYVGMNTNELKHRIKQEKKKVAYIYRHYFLKKKIRNGGDGIE